MSQETEYAPSMRQGEAAGAVAMTFWVTAFVIALLIPIQIHLGSIRLSFYRIVLLLSIIPIVASLASSSPIRLRLADILVLVYALTGAFSLFMTNATLAAIGIFIVESVVPYFLARTFIRNSHHFNIMARVLVICIIGTIPFALYENLTRDPIILTVLDKFLPVLSNVPHEQRLGLDRAQVTFDHPILYGVFCAFGFAIAFYATRSDTPYRLSFGRGTLVGLAAFLSLSTGALVAVAFQGVLILYDLVMRNVRQRWAILATATAITYAVVEGLSNRTVAQIAIPYIALNPGTAWTRLAVNEWAWSGIMAHPWFGFGFTLYWPAPFWVVTTSIDNFWLAIGFRHGLPTMLLLIGVVGAVLWAVIFTRQNSPFVRACRTGFVITIIGICLAVYTVHLWNSTYVAFLFLLGSGMWMAEEQKNNLDSGWAPEQPSQRSTTRFSRNLVPTYHRADDRANRTLRKPVSERLRERR